MTSTCSRAHEYMKFVFNKTLFRGNHIEFFDILPFFISSALKYAHPYILMKFAAIQVLNSIQLKNIIIAKYARNVVKRLCKINGLYILYISTKVNTKTARDQSQFKLSGNRLR